MFPDLLGLEDGDANVYRLVLCVRIPCVSANLSLLRISNLPWSPARDHASTGALLEHRQRGSGACFGSFVK